MDEVQLFTDGSSIPNPGPGGWGAILRCRGVERELSGFEIDSTNNRMELMAVIGGLEALKKPCRVTIIIDSRYVMDSATKWLGSWRARGWRNKEGDQVKNIDLWQRYHAIVQPHQLEWQWIKGHTGHPENERVDALAKAAAMSLRGAKVKPETATAPAI